MPLLTFLRRPQNELEPGGRCKVQADQTDPEETCPNCHRSVEISSIWENFNTCPKCGYHYRTGARQRLNFIVDTDSFTEMFADIQSADPLEFPSYRKKLATVRAASGEKEALICGTAKIGGQPCCLFIMEPKFMMGSMGTAVGEKIVLLFEYATEQRLPVVGYTVSGGARMQEGLFSLMQMAKTSGAVMKHSQTGLFYLPFLTSPTTGGVTASFAMEGDIILAEPGATIGFAGARVVEQTTRKTLPKGFQTAEFLLKHGFIDAIVPRTEQKQVITDLLKMHTEGSDHE